MSMANFCPFKFLLSLFLLVWTATSSSASGDRKTYIIHMDKPAMPSPFSTHHDWYMSTLSSLSSSSDVVAPTHIYTYTHVMDGFSAVLSQAHLDQIRNIPGHLAAYPDAISHLHTTRTPKFLGLKKRAGIWPAAGFGNDIIIGVIDSGIWPESESFNDDGMPPVPARWRGICEVGTEFNSSHCNKKLIGARSFSKGLKQNGFNISKTDDYDSPRDFHAGSRVQHADYFGYSKGTAIGVAPMARIAILEEGIFVSCSAGNSGPHAYTILNGAPWITTIGAGTIDRDFAAHITLGNNELTVTGRSVYPENLFVSEVPKYFGHGNQSKELCALYSLDSTDVAGKYIFCAFDHDGLVGFAKQLNEMNRTGTAGAIFSSDKGKFLDPTDFNMPFVTINPKDGELVKNYMMNVKNATVSIKFQITVLGTKPAPQVEFFSSRGPARQSPYILKPDILAPGVDILASWVPNRGIAALLKAVHRDWSSAAIRSAMMTTANIYDNANGIIVHMDNRAAGTPLDFGAGHVNPNKAMDPGLVYDIEIEDYINYLCGLNYTSNQIRVLTGTSNFTCEHANLDLNYPSFIIILNNTNSTSFIFKRVLTNVADGSSVYRAMVNAPKGMKVVVQPVTISFAGKYSKAEFNMTVSISLGTNAIPEDDYIGNFGFLSWY
ncbi:hypothetical protein Ddye_003672 [Dipteronia dyeriana]|uniref:Uncharacterized protein n=1 Tax=Dipteronia dyeriana TaxID=168575 RepID=A0AAE0CW78_9ROSI|nr:hypothetical protein Ddye_003672 [Dipteronia dyeriana]